MKIETIVTVAGLWLVVGYLVAQIFYWKLDGSRKAAKERSDRIRPSNPWVFDLLECIYIIAWPAVAIAIIEYSSLVWWHGNEYMEP